MPREASADAGYLSSKVVEQMTALGMEVFIPPDKVRHTAPVAPAPRGHIPQGMNLSGGMRRKLRTKRGKRRYTLRMKSVGPILGHIKQGRGFRQFLLRGLAKVRGEWQLACTGHNLMKLFGIWKQGRICQFLFPPHSGHLRLKVSTEVVDRGRIWLDRISTSYGTQPVIY